MHISTTHANPGYSQRIQETHEVGGFLHDCCHMEPLLQRSCENWALNFRAGKKNGMNTFLSLAHLIVIKYHPRL